MTNVPLALTVWEPGQVFIDLIRFDSIDCEGSSLMEWCLNLIQFVYLIRIGFVVMLLFMQYQYRTRL